MLRNSSATDRDTWSRTCGLLILGFACYALPWRVFAGLPVPADNHPVLQIQGVIFKRQLHRMSEGDCTDATKAFHAGLKIVCLWQA